MKTFDENARKKLMNELQSMVTRDGLSCAGFKIIPDPSQVRMNAEQFLKSSSDSYRVLGAEELSRILLSMAQEEEKNKDERREEMSLAMSSIYEGILKLISDVVGAFEQLKEEAILETKKSFRDTKPATMLFKCIGKESFPEAIDEFLAKFNSRKKTGWKTILERKLSESIQIADEKITASFAEAKKMLNVKYVSIRGIQEHCQVIFEKNSSFVCMGSRGICPTFRSVNEHAVMFLDGFLKIIDFNEPKIKEGYNFPFQGKHSHSSIEFSPNGKMLAVSSYFEKTLSIYGFPEFTQASVWKNDDAKYILRVKWVGSKEVIASYGWPGELRVFRVGQSKPLLKILPLEMVDSKIIDFDLCYSEKWENQPENLKEDISKNIVPTSGRDGFLLDDRECQAICGSYKIVFKVDITGNYHSPRWRHGGHKNFVTVIKVSNDGLYVVSGGSDMQIVLTQEATGSILFTFDDLSCEVNGLFWGIGDQVLVASSAKGLLLLQVKKESLILKQKTTHESTLEGMNICWSQEQIPYAIIGQGNGKIIRLNFS